MEGEGGGGGGTNEDDGVGSEHETTVRFARLAVAALFNFFLLNLGFFAIVFNTFAKFFSVSFFFLGLVTVGVSRLAFSQIEALNAGRRTLFVVLVLVSIGDLSIVIGIVFSPMLFPSDEDEEEESKMSMIAGDFSLTETLRRFSEEQQRFPSEPE